MDIQVSERLISFITFIPFFVLSITVHEFAHAFSASRFGDDTAKKLGRQTLNPVKHIDLVGTILLPIAAFASGFALIGWAKPVPIDRRNFKNVFKDDAIVTFAGPLSNFLLSLIFLVVFILLNGLNLLTTPTLINIFWYGMFINVFLFLFNLLPIPPLDGSHILFDLWPNKYTAKYLNLGFYGAIILLAFIYSPLWGLFMKLINFIMNIFISVSGY